MKDGPVGIYSLQKFPSVSARRNGCAEEDDVNSPGGWCKHKGQVDAYLQLEFPCWPDAKVPWTLCMGGPCRYALKENSGGTTDHWLLAHVMPNILVKFETAIALTLARPHLWVCLVDNDHCHYPPSGVRNHVQNAYQNLLNHLPDNENWVKKMLLVVPMSLNVLVNIDDAVAGGNNNGVGAQNNNQMAAMRWDKTMHCWDKTWWRQELNEGAFSR